MAPPIERIWRCTCSHPVHTLSVSWWPDDHLLFVEVVSTRATGWRERALAAWRALTGAEHVVADVVLTAHQAAALGAELNAQLARTDARLVRRDHP